MLHTRLFELREKRGYSQKELSKRLGMARTTYSGYEGGNREPDHETLQKIADFYDVSLDYLLGRSEFRNYREEQEASAKRLIEYLELELTNDDIKDRMVFKVDNMVLSNEEMDDFINFVRVNRLMKKQQSAALKFDEP